MKAGELPVFFSQFFLRGAIVTDYLFTCPQCRGVSIWANAYLDPLGNRLCSDECRCLWLKENRFIIQPDPNPLQMLSAPAPAQLGADDRSPTIQIDDQSYLLRTKPRQMA